MKLHTLQGILSAFSLFFVLATSTGCGLMSKPKETTVKSPVSRIYKYQFDKVWEATQKVLSKYSISVNNIDLGLLKTEHIKVNSIWKSPHQKKEPSGGYKYQITVRLVKGKHNGKPSTKVSVFKKIKLQKDFFTKVKLKPTDGLEEKVILYRILREIKIKNAIDKLQSQSNS